MTKRIAYAGMLTALALIFSYVETLLPVSFGVPGIKLGLANLIVITGIYFMRPTDVFGIMVARIFLASFMFGNMAALIYSLFGGILSFAVMLLLSRRKRLSMIGVSMAGGVSHNIGQILVAMYVVENANLLYYLPILCISGVLTGMLIGYIGKKCLPLIRKYA